MNSLFLTTTELNRLLKVFAWLIGLLWLSFFLVQLKLFGISASSAAVKSFSAAIAVSALLFGLFYKVAWRWEWLAKWMNRPIVHGVWQGELRSDFESRGSTPLVIPVFFVIKQTYLTLSVESFTESQEGESRLEAILRNAKTDACRLCYVFELRKLYPGASSLTNGTGDLKLLGNSRQLSGTYWTNTPTHGELSLTLVTREIEGIASFQDAKVKAKRYT